MGWQKYHKISRPAMYYIGLLTFLTFLKRAESSGAEVERECSPIFRDIKIGSTHVMCMPRSPAVVYKAMSDKEKEMIVNKHNDMRANVNRGIHPNPTASYMMKLVWDDLLAEMAQAYSESCPSRKAKDIDNMFPGRYVVDQNFDSMTGTKNWQELLSIWGDRERGNFKYGDRTVKWYQYHHYARMIYASFTRVGCGMAMCKDKGPIRHIFVCNYAPRVANPVVPKPYEEGTPCSRCPGSCNGKNLCDCNGQTCRNDGRLDPETCKCGCQTQEPFTHMYTPSDCALNCTCAKNKDGTDLAFYCGRKNWNNCAHMYVLTKCPVYCKICPAADTAFIPEVPYVDTDLQKDKTDAFDEGKSEEKVTEATEAPVNVAKPEQKLNDDVIIKTKTEINTKGEAKSKPSSIQQAEKEIEKAREEAAAKAKEVVKNQAKMAADNAIDNYVERFLNGTNSETKDKVLEYLKKYNITLGGASSHHGSSLLYALLVLLVLFMEFLK